MSAPAVTAHEFYYGHDWDLWYRLGALGLFQSIDQPLYIARVTPGSISGSSRNAQHALARLSHRALLLRSHGESDAAILAQAARIQTTRGWDVADARARDYLRAALRQCPLLLRAWIRYTRTLTR
jgi:hypothetical protein